MVKGPIANGPDRLSHVLKVRASERRVTSLVMAISFAESDPVQIGQFAGISSTRPQVLVRMADQDRRCPRLV
jgi:hypothetical protein